MFNRQLIAYSNHRMVAVLSERKPHGCVAAAVSPLHSSWADKGAPSFLHFTLVPTRGRTTAAGPARSALSLSLQEPLLDVTRLKETEWMVFVYCTLKKQAKKLGVAPCLRRRPASSSTPLVSAKGLAGRAPSV